MIGVDFNEASRMATKINLAKHDIPHMVLFGDIGKPADIMKALQKKKVDLTKALHVRSTAVLMGSLFVRRVFFLLYA